MLLRGRGSYPASSERERILFSLEFAVPQAIEQMRAARPETREHLAGTCAAVIAADPGGLLTACRFSQEKFSALADGLAALAFRPGGITWLGQHWHA